MEFCQQIMVGEVDLETMRAEFDAAEAEKERRAIRRAVAEAKEFRGHLERAGISYPPAAPGGITGRNGRPGPQYPPGI